MMLTVTAAVGFVRASIARTITSSVGEPLHKVVNIRQEISSSCIGSGMLDCVSARLWSIDNMAPAR